MRSRRWSDPMPVDRAVPADADDDHVIGAALGARADAIATGDRHLLELDPYRGIRILTPAAALELVSLEGRRNRCVIEARTNRATARDRDDRSPRTTHTAGGWRMPCRRWRNWTTRSWRTAFRKSGRPSGRRPSGSSSAWPDTRGRRTVYPTRDAEVAIHFKSAGFARFRRRRLLDNHGRGECYAYIGGQVVGAPDYDRLRRFPLPWTVGRFRLIGE